MHSCCNYTFFTWKLLPELRERKLPHSTSVMDNAVFSGKWPVYLPVKDIDFTSATAVNLNKEK